LRPFWGYQPCTNPQHKIVFNNKIPPNWKNFKRARTSYLFPLLSNREFFSPPPAPLLSLPLSTRPFPPSPRRNSSLSHVKFIIVTPEPMPIDKEMKVADKSPSSVLIILVFLSVVFLRFLSLTLRSQSQFIDMKHRFGASPLMSTRRVTARPSPSSPLCRSAVRPRPLECPLSSRLISAPSYPCGFAEVGVRRLL